MMAQDSIEVGRISSLIESIGPYRTQVIGHPVYNEIQQIEDLRSFMQSHVFAVWDFMSLLKSLQNDLTCVVCPWIPKGNPNTRYLINEIVVGEESDASMDGGRISHFELYHLAMHACGADTRGIDTFISSMKQGRPLLECLHMAEARPEVIEFVNFTFEVIACGKTHLKASLFTFGREDLIPDMFLSIIDRIGGTAEDQVSVFQYYLERHIDLDANHHGPLTKNMMAELCGENLEHWAEAEEIAIKALKMRIRLWDGVLSQILENRQDRATFTWDGEPVQIQC
jgi:hypothetical protein